MTRPLRVFLCHSSNDKPAVRELYQKLRAEIWIEPWLDEEELYPGQDWNLEIEKAVEAADAIIVCLSKGSITKEGYVQRELRSVLDFADYKPEGTLYIMPVRLEECEPPRRLRSWQYADYFEGQRERAFKRLLVSLKRRADALGLTTDDIKEEPKKEIPAKPFTKILNPSSLAPKAIRDSQGVKKPLSNNNVRWFGIGGIIFIGLLITLFSRDYFMRNLPVPTSSITKTATPTAPVQLTLPMITDTSMPTITPVPLTFTPSLEIVSIKPGKWTLFITSPCGNFNNFYTSIFDVNADGTFITGTEVGTWVIVGNKITFTIDQGVTLGSGSFVQYADQYIGMIDGDKIKQGQIFYPNSPFGDPHVSRCWDGVLSK